MSSEQISSAVSTQSIRAKFDPTWEHCTKIPKEKGRKPRLRCLYYGKEFGGGGIHRMKQHLARKKGDVTSCKSVPHDVRYRLEENLKEIGQRRPVKKLRKEEDNPLEVDDEIMQEIIPSSSSQLAKKKASAAGDKFFAPRISSRAQPGIRSAFTGKEALHRADLAVDQRNRQLINFLIYYPGGMIFIKSVDASNIVKDAQNLCNFFMDMVAFVGADNVVHLLTDNATNYKATGSKMEIVSSLATRESMVSKFIYNYVFLLAWLRKREGWTEIIRLSATRFATTFIALKSIYEHKHDIQALITSKTFVEFRYYQDSKEKDMVMIVLDNQFWNNCKTVVEIVKPLVRLLRIIDSDDRYSIGYVYDGMYREKRAIKNIFRHKKSLYKPYTSIIKRTWDFQLRQNLYAATYLFNLAFLYDKENFSRKPEIDYWVMEEDDCSLLNIDDIEQDLIYDDTVLPKAIIHQEDEEDNEQRGNVAHGEAIGGLDLQLFSQEDVDSFSEDVDAFEPAHAWINQDLPIFDKP
ncbi:uncharacterized protein LOC129290084 [Prosopis cineraria]|uniref:uncharacterized protein LOC129290084 n=1 Tax=Prosopis cineraria TaxID=364024 RepID=UPI00241089E6|nr:uncharacterized protein LOC129290084 [Prosopis cineraria]